MKNLVFLTLLLTMLFLGIVCAEAADRYVRAGATGTNNGNDWTNAFTSLPASLVRGDTYYIADGTYPCRTFNTPASGTSIITIKKATVANHGITTGWLDTYGDGEALFFSSGSGCLAFDTDYWIFDGVVGGGPGSWTTGHGFRIDAAVDNASGTTALMKFNYGGGGNIDHVEILHTAAARVNYGGGNICDAGTCPAIVYAQNLSSSRFAYDYFHDTDSYAAMRGTGWNDVIIEYTYFENINRKEVLACSGNCRNLTIRWNIFKNVAGTGHIVATTAGDTAPVTNWIIYGNILFNTSSTWFLNDCVWCTNIGHGQSSSGVLIYNNTFVNIYGTAFGTANFENCTGCQARNNLFYTTTGRDYGYSSNFNKDFDWCYPSADCSNIAAETNDQAGTGNPFVNLAGEDFRLTAATNAGSTLSAPYNIDMFGNVRGTDGVWDRGAIEFGSGGVNPPPLPPTNVRIQ